MGETTTDDLKRVRQEAERRAALRRVMEEEQRAQIPGAFQRGFGSAGGQPGRAPAPSATPYLDQLMAQEGQRGGAPAPLNPAQRAAIEAARARQAGAPGASGSPASPRSYAEITAALRNAHAAGDTASARRLALMAVEAQERERGQQPPPAQRGTQSGPPVEVQLPSGTIAEFPAGTPQEVIGPAIDRLFLEQEAQQPGSSGLTRPGLEAVRRRVGALSVPPIPGSTVPGGVDANAFGAPLPNADALSSLLTPEGQARRRVEEEVRRRAAAASGSGSGGEYDELLRLAQERQTAARGSLTPEERAAITAGARTRRTGENLRAEIDRNSVHEGSLWERAGLTPSQMGTAFRENLFGDDDPSTMNFGETLAAGLNNAGEALTYGLLGDEAAGRVDSWLGRGTYEERRDFYRDQEAQLWDQHPGVALGSEIGGGLLSPGAPARWINRGVGLLSRVWRGAAVGAGTGAVYGAMEAESDMIPAAETGRNVAGSTADRVMGGLLGAGIGGAAGGALVGIGQGFIRAAQALRGTPGGEEVAASVARLKDASQGLYRAADEAGVVIPQARLGQLATEAVEAIRSAGYNARLHPRLRAVLGELKDVAQGDQSLGRLEIARRVAGNAGASLQPDERRLAGLVIDRIDNMIEELGEASAPLRAARELWARGSRLGRVEEIMENAGNAGRDTSYETALANGFRSFLRNPRNLRGFSEAERRLMKQIAQGSAGVRALRGLADLLAPNSLTGAGAAVGAFMNAGSVAGVLPPFVSLGSRAASNALVRGQGNALVRMAGQSDAQRALADGLLRQPNALAALTAAPTPQGLLSYFGAQ